jgi:hypothetical protein
MAPLLRVELLGLPEPRAQGALTLLPVPSVLLVLLGLQLLLILLERRARRESRGRKVPGNGRLPP